MYVYVCVCVLNRCEGEADGSRFVVGRLVCLCAYVCVCVSNIYMYGVCIHACMYVQVTILCTYLEVCDTRFILYMASDISVTVVLKALTQVLFAGRGDEALSLHRACSYDKSRV
jgi:hypothetical protein